MVKQINLAECGADELMLAFEDARNAIVPDLATCSARDLAVAFARARVAVRSARRAADRTVQVITFRSLAK